jgi:hypothetical protein
MEEDKPINKNDLTADVNQFKRAVTRISNQAKHYYKPNYRNEETQSFAASKYA